MHKLQVVKIGGNVIDDDLQLEIFLNAFHNVKGPKILVHGGGKLATDVSKKLGLETTMIHGRRITTDDDLDVVVMVYGGLINKRIVATLQSLGCNAVGLSGADGNSIRSVKRPVTSVDYGWVGDIEEVNDLFLQSLITQNLVPVLCALTHDGKGQLLNTNADTIAAEVAIAMSRHFETELIYCFEKNGVLRDVHDDQSVIEHINRHEYDALKMQNLIHAGMIPKMENCFRALEHHTSKVVICNSAFFHTPGHPFSTITL